MAFSPDEALREEAELAAARWSVATGCEVVLAEGGVPITAWRALFVEYAPDDRPILAETNDTGTKREKCGLSRWDDEDRAVVQIDVSLACDTEDAVAHEMGHALSGLKRHSFTGVMADGHNPDRTPLIDVGSLEIVCYARPCPRRVPELE